MSARLRHLALVAAIALAGCGGDEEPSPVARTQPPVGAPAVTATPTPVPTPSPTPSPSATPVEGQEGDAGDEEAPRVPVALTIDDGGITPPQVAVPAFFPIVLTIRNELDRAVTVRLGDVKVRALGQGLGQGRHPGLRAGEHAVRAGSAGRATIVAGAEAGP